MSKENLFFSGVHKKAFIELLGQADLNEYFKKPINSLGYRQVAFLYLIALYQEDYEQYEGYKFYVEDLGELSLDGPVYLLEEEFISLSGYDHEQMLRLAMKLLQGYTVALSDGSLPMHLEEPLRNAIGLSTGEIIADII